MIGADCARKCRAHRRGWPLDWRTIGLADSLKFSRRDEPSPKSVGQPAMFLDQRQISNIEILNLYPLQTSSTESVLERLARLPTQSSCLEKAKTTLFSNLFYFVGHLSIWCPKSRPQRNIADVEGPLVAFRSWRAAAAKGEITFSETRPPLGSIHRRPKANLAIAKAQLERAVDGW